MSVWYLKTPLADVAEGHCFLEGERMCYLFVLPHQAESFRAWHRRDGERQKERGADESMQGQTLASGPTVSVTLCPYNDTILTPQRLSCLSYPKTALVGQTASPWDSRKC